MINAKTAMVFFKNIPPCEIISITLTLIKDFGDEKMGRVRPQLVKRTAIKLMKENEDKFSTDFEENKKTITEVLELDSKIMRNRIAGYITSLERRRQAENGA